MDIYEYLKMDHRQVSSLFAQFEKTKDHALKCAIVSMILQELYLHAESEEATFYKALAQFKATKGVVLHGKKEHKEMKAMMREVDDEMEDSDVWNKKVIQLKKLVEHHVNEEEGEIFRKAKKVLPAPQPFVLREQMHYLKSKLKNKLMKNEHA